MFANIKRMNAETDEDLSILLMDDIDPMIVGLYDKMKELAIRRQKGSTVSSTGYLKTIAGPHTNGSASCQNSLENGS